MANPAFRNEAFHEDRFATAPDLSAEELQARYEAPAAIRPGDDVMTIQDTVVKSVATFAVLLLGAGVGWVFAAVPGIWVGAALVALVLGFVNAFKRVPSAPLVLLYSAAEGIFVGGLSGLLEAQFHGIVSQAVIATFVVVGVTLALFASGRIRASARATKVFLIALVGYGLFSLLNVILMVTGVSTDPWGLRTGVTLFGIPLGVLLGVLAVLLGAYSLVLDFDFIQRGARNGLPRVYGWQGAFGIVVDVVWLYTEILRLLAIARR